MTLRLSDIDLVAEAKRELSSRRLGPDSPMHRATVEDIDDPAVAIERTYALLLHLLDGTLESEADVAMGHPIVDALLSLRDDPRLDRRRFAQGRMAPAIDRLPKPKTPTDISEALARHIKACLPDQAWKAEQPLTHQSLGVATGAQRALVLVEMMRQKGVLDV